MPTPIRLVSRLLYGSRTGLINKYNRNNPISISPLTTRKFCSCPEPTESTKKLKADSEHIYFHNTHLWDSSLLARAQKDCELLDDFITEEEETKLLTEIESPLRRLRYEESHWDDAIYLYRETEKTRWSEGAKSILDRVKERGFSPEAQHLGYIHILDLHKDGHIKPHIDAVRYCGDTIVGLSLLSSSVMRLIHKDEKNCIIDLLLCNRSMYILRGVLRYEFTHEILGKEASYFGQLHVPRERRISVMCRNLPAPDQQADLEKGLSWNSLPE